MTVDPKVSIVIPVYNGTDYLREAIDSALAQTYRNIEVVVVNDGSRDGGQTDEIARSYGDRIRYIHKENGGVATALNTGIRAMEGELFSWLSHDDRYLPEKVERQVDCLKKEGGACIVYSDFELIDEQSKVFAVDRREAIAPEDFLYALITLGHVNGCTTLIPKSCFEESGLFDEALKTTQDYALWFAFAQKYRFVQLREVLVQSRAHPGQGSNVIPTHWNAINELHEWFLAEVDARRLIDVAPAEKPRFYLDIADRLNRRYIYRAASFACDLSGRYAMENGFLQLMKVLPQLGRYKLAARKNQLMRFLTVHKKRLVG